MFYPEIGFSDGRVHSLFFIGSMGLVNLPTGMVHFYGKLVGRYTGFWDNLFAYVSEPIFMRGADSRWVHLGGVDPVGQRKQTANAFSRLVISFLWPIQLVPPVFETVAWQQTIGDGGTCWLVTAPKKCGSSQLASHLICIQPLSEEIH